MMAANDRNASDFPRPLRPGVIVRLLLHASTSVWRDRLQLAEPVRSRLLALNKSGWMIREASPRNFIIWRSEIRYSGLTGIIVLPSSSIALDGNERSAIAFDMLDAAGAIDLDGEAGLPDDHGLHFDSDFQRGMSKIQQALSYGYAIKNGDAIWRPHSGAAGRGRRTTGRK